MFHRLSPSLAIVCCHNNPPTGGRSRGGRRRDRGNPDAAEAPPRYRVVSGRRGTAARPHRGAPCGRASGAAERSARTCRDGLGFLPPGSRPAAAPPRIRRDGSEFLPPGSRLVAGPPRMRPRDLALRPERNRPPAASGRTRRRDRGTRPARTAVHRYCTIFRRGRHSGCCNNCRPAFSYSRSHRSEPGSLCGSSDRPVPSNIRRSSSRSQADSTCRWRSEFVLPRRGKAVRPE